MPDECRQQLGLAMKPTELLDQDRPQLGRVLGREVRQPAVLGVPPHPLVGVGLGGVARERLRDDPGVLRQVGLIESNVIWLGQPDLALASVIWVHTWRIVPLAAVIVMAGMLAIPTEIRDASDIDGAGFWRRYFELTLPLMLPVMAVATLFGAILTFTDMAVVYVLTRGGPTNETQVLASWAFYRGIEGSDIGQGAAIALFLFPLLLAAAIAILRAVRRTEVS